ncbi:unnamed protein product [Ophioblennius macclurei]
MEWPPLENITDQSVEITEWNDAVNDTVTVSVKNKSIASYKCVCSNKKERRNLTIKESEVQEEDFLTELWRIVKQLHVNIAFVIGLLLGMIFTSIIACLAIKCRRQKQKPGRLTEDLEMDVGHAIDDEGIHDQEEAEMIVNPTGPSTSEGNVRPNETEYSDIDFSMLKTKNPTEQELTKTSAETEYAEIKTETQDKGDGNDGEETGGVKDDVGTKEESEEETALYSNVKEIMDEV